MKKIMHGRRFILPGAVALLCLLQPLSAWPHGWAGKRFFPSTLATDDPFVMDEFSLLGLYRKEGGEGDEPNQEVAESSAEYVKRITPHFGITLEGAWRHVNPVGDESSKSGFDNLGVGVKYQFFTSAYHETLASIGVDVDVGGTGDEKVGAESFTVVTPTVFFGKGMGDLPDSMKYLKPLAVTGIVGGSIPTDDRTVRHVDGEREVERNPNVLEWGLAVEYSIPYLQSFIRDIGLGAPFNRMIPLVEVAMETCLNRGCGGETTGTVNPGVIWVGKYFQLGLEAIVPVNSRTGGNVGVLAQFHIFVDDTFPRTIGRPLFNNL